MSLVPRRRPRIPAFAPVPTRTRRDGWTLSRQAQFIGALAETGPAAAAAARVGMRRESAWRLRSRAGAESFAAVQPTWPRHRRAAGMANWDQVKHICHSRQQIGRGRLWRRAIRLRSQLPDTHQANDKRMLRVREYHALRFSEGPHL